MLSAAPDRELRTLLDELSSGRRAEISLFDLQSLGLPHLARHAARLTALDPAALRLLLEAVLAERATKPPRPELVWTGPEGALASARSTEVVFRDLLGSAQRDVWMVGYSIDHGGDLFAPLHRAMSERPLRVRFLLNLQYDRKDRRERSDEAGATVLLQRFLREQWPFDGPKPELYWDPRTLSRDIYASVHAKLVVVDETQVLLGSANFTKRGQQRNIEAGVLLSDPAFARQLVTQLQSLIDGDHIRRYDP